MKSFACIMCDYDVWNRSFYENIQWSLSVAHSIMMTIRRTFVRDSDKRSQMRKTWRHKNVSQQRVKPFALSGVTNQAKKYTQHFKYPQQINLFPLTHSLVLARLVVMSNKKKNSKVVYWPIFISTREKAPTKTSDREEKEATSSFLCLYFYQEILVIFICELECLFIPKRVKIILLLRCFRPD